MDAERWQEIKSIFHEVRRAPQEARDELLESKCSGDPELRDRVLRLIEADAAAEGFLEPSSVEYEPDRIGPYEVLATIGSGGMGVVYMAAEVGPTRRKVAVKLIRSGAAGAQAPQRFEAEQRALALMDHPGIARIFHAGMTEEGRPYFAMEYVPGVPITEYCDTHELPLRERLELLIQVCDAIQHAHDHGVIHRDLKPSNILVKQDGDAHSPKIIDFGIAKAVDQRLTANTLQTVTGTVIGTPEYMSPEQADPLGSKVDATSDVYSLGVILYRLITGVSPFKDSGSEQRQARFDFPTPSERIRSIEAGDLQRIVQERRTDEQTLRGDLHRLDAIVSRTLRVNPRERYSQPSQLAADLRSYLAGKSFGARSTRSGWLLKSLALMGAVVAIVFLATRSGWGPWDRVPYAVEVKGDVMRVVNEANEELWKRRYHALRREVYTSGFGTQRGHRWLLADIKGDRRLEVLFIESSPDHVAYLHAYDDRGREIWEAPFHFGRVEGLIDPDTGKPFGDLFKAFIIGVVDSDGRRLIALHASHRRYPTRVLLLDAEDASVVSEYLHPGYVYAARIMDLDFDGKEELVLGGTRNPDKADWPALFSLDIPFETKHGGDRHAFGEQYRMERDYVLFPTIPAPTTNRIRNIKEAGDSLEIQVEVLSWLVFYQVTLPDLQPVGSQISDNLRRELHKQEMDVEAVERLLDRFARFDTAPKGSDEEIELRFEPIPELLKD